jgi:hypothetical protein
VDFPIERVCMLEFQMYISGYKEKRKMDNNVNFCANEKAGLI